MNTNVSYEQAKNLKIAAYNLVSYACSKLNNIEGINSGQYGLTPDHIKAGQEYKIASAAYDIAFADMRKINAWFNKTYKKECALERKNKTLLIEQLILLNDVAV